jgi:hypothetical protein
MHRLLLPDVERAAAGQSARASCLTLLACFLATATAAAQASRTDRAFPATFSTSNQSMWGPGTAPLNNFDRKMTIFDVGWAVGDTVGDIRSFDTFLFGEVAFGGEIGAFSTGTFKSTLEFTDVGTGVVGVTYPVDVTLGIPDVNSFRDGQTITIPSSFALRPGAALTTAAPRGGIDVRLGAAVAGGAHTQVCIFGCVTFPLFPEFSFGDPDMQLFSLGVDPDGQDFAQLFGLPRFNLPHELTFIESEISGLSGKFGLPKVHTASAVQPDLRSLAAAGRDTFFNIKLDIDGFLTLKIPLGFETPDFHGAKLKYETVDLSAVARIFQDQTFTFTPRVYGTLVFPQPVEYWEVDGSGTDVNGGTAATITFEVGNTLRLVYPSGLRTPMAINPTWSIRNIFTSSTVNEFREDLELTVGEFELKVPSVELFPSVTTDACYFATVTLDVANIIPNESCPVTTPAVTSPAFDIDLGPLLHQSLFGLAQTMTLFPFASSDCAPGSDGCGRWELAGFNTAPGESFILDPEDPIIAVSTTLASGLSSGTGPPGTITQSILVRNLGDVPLSLTQIADALSAAIAGAGGFTVEHIASPDLTEDLTFNGVAKPMTLTGADVLAVGASGNIGISVRVAPANLFTSLLNADSRSPIGTIVQASAAASFGVFAFNILPSSQNTASNGVLPVVVLGSQGMDPATIDVSTARLEGVAPVRSELVSRGGFNDLTLKFDRQAILAALQTRLAASPVTVAVLGAALAMPDAASPPDPALVARAVLGDGRALTAEQVRAVDSNGNGIVDIGDLRALLRGGGGGSPAVPPPVELFAAAGPAAGPRGPSGTSLVLVLTGRLRDGTPFMGENSLIIANNGSAQ